MSYEKDLRVLKTRRLIRDALVTLIEKKGFKNITVNDIAEQAMINRSTFYHHYTDKYELLDQMVNELIAELMTLVAPEAHVKGGKLEYSSFVDTIQTILSVVAKDAQLVKVVMSDNEMIRIRRRMENTLKEKLDKSFQEQILISKDLFLELITSLYMAAIEWWVNNDMKYSAGYMAEQLVRMLAAGPVKTAGLGSM
ncbi:TetR/AcrR family transcriptional regulator [Paenibacillus sp. FSL L8-0470]|uniref:TetR/AcrR family transcriptional regulator n=1 Tax=unclassified Paenibacillus TaxID=185978 RepID=UPI0030F85FA6